MGSANSLPLVEITYHKDRAGDYSIVHKQGQWSFAWGTTFCGVEVTVYRKNKVIIASLLRNNKSKKVHQHFYDGDNKGHLNVETTRQIVEIKDVMFEEQGICSDSLYYVLFAAIRVYAAEFVLPVTGGFVNIHSNNAISAYHAYNNAFERNGFCTDVRVPSSFEEEKYLVTFVKKIHKTLKIK